MPYEIYKNAVIPASVTTVAGSETPAYSGERRLGSAGITGDTVVNPNGTTTAYPALNEIISTVPICKRCGLPLKDKAEKVDWIHAGCRDNDEVY